MNSKISLADFHFSPEKTGKTFNRWQDEANVGNSYIVKETGITLDRLKNNKRGEVQDPKIELVFKVAIALGKGVNGVVEFINDQLEGENIDFADQLHTLDGKAPSMQAYLDTLPHVEVAPELPAPPRNKAATIADFEAYAQHMHAEHAEILDRFKNVYAGHIAQLNAQIEQLKVSRDIMQEQYKAQLAKMEEQHRFHDHAMETAHSKEREVDEQHFQLERSGWKKTIEQQDDNIHRLRKNNLRCVLAICAEAFLLFIALLIVLFR